MILLLPSGRYTQQIDIGIEEEGDKWVVSSPYNAQLVKELKAMEGARWNPNEKVWKFDRSERNLYALEYLQGNKPANYFDSPQHLTRCFDRPMFRHQLEGVDFVLQRKRCMLNFDMGLGKTLTMIEVMERATALSNGHIQYWWLVAPLGAQKEWARQLKRWKAKVVPLVIITYESLSKKMDQLDDRHIPEGIILDESIKIKNPQSQRSQATYEICRLMRERHDDPYIVALTGAPAPKCPDEWWHQIEVLCPGFLREGDIYKFRQRYAEIEWVDEGYGKFPKILGWKEDELEALGRRLRPIVLRKKKKDCLDLPAKVYDIIEVDRTTDQFKELRRVASAMAEMAESPIQALEILRELSDGFRYRKKSDQVDDLDEDSTNSDSDLSSNKCTYDWIGSPKTNIIEELLDFYHTDNGGCGRLVIYAAFHATIDKLVALCNVHRWDARRVDGRGWNASILDEFETVGIENMVIVANPACVHGLTLSQTQCLCYYSNTFSADARIQSMDRRDRPGADKEVATRIVDIYNLHTDRMIKEKLDGNIAMQEITLEEILKCLQ